MSTRSEFLVLSYIAFVAGFAGITTVIHRRRGRLRYKGAWFFHGGWDWAGETPALQRRMVPWAVGRIGAVSGL